MSGLQKNVTAIAITGIGLVTPLGCGLREVGDRLRSGATASSVRDFDPERYTDSPSLRRMTAGTQYGLCAAIQAVADAGFPWKRGTLRDDVRIHYAATHPVTSFVEEFHRTLLEGGPSTATPMCFAAGVNNAAPFYIADEFGITGGILTLVGTNAEGLSALLLGCDALECRSANIVLAGASTEVTPTLVDIHRKLGCLSGKGICRPYDRARDGLVLGEGGGFVVLERLEDAVQRGARVHGVVERGDVNRSPALLIGSANGLPADAEEARIFSRWSEATVANVTPNIGEGFAFSAILSVVAGLWAIADGVAPPLVNLTDPEISGIRYSTGEKIPFARAVIHARRPDGESILVALNSH